MSYTHTQCTHSFRENQRSLDDIGGDMEVVEQLICIVHSPSFSARQAQMALCILVCCLSSVQVHKRMEQSSILDGVMDACKVRRNMGAEESELKLLR